MEAVVDWIAEPLQFEFMRRALLTAVVAGIACAILSCWMTLLGWSLMGDAVSHAVLPGVVLSYVFGLPFAIGATVFGVAAVAMIGGVNRTSRVKEDAAMGIVFTGLFALGLILVSVIPSQVDLFHVLFGNVLGVSNSDIIQVVVLGSIASAILLTLRRSLVLFAFDPVHAHAVGLRTRWLEALLLGLLALTAVVGLQAVGIVLVIAMLITPGATAYLLTDRFDRMLTIAIATGTTACVVGTYASYHLDASTGGSIVCALTLIFAGAYLFSPRYGLIGRIRKSRTRSESPLSERSPADDQL